MIVRNLLVLFPLLISLGLTMDDDIDLALATALSLDEVEKKLAIETDATIAQNLQEGAYKVLDPDEALALKLSQLTSNQEAIYSEAQQIIHPLMVKYKECFDQNVHKFNAFMNWSTTLSQLMAFYDKLYPEHVLQQPHEIFDLVTKTLPYQDLDNAGKQAYKKNVDLLLTHIKSSMCESAETKASLDQLVSRIWALSVHYRDEHYRLVSLLVPTLIDNVATGGGCYPGFAGRLCSVFLVLMNDLTKLTNTD
jgi:hypothetical protein